MKHEPLKEGEILIACGELIEVHNGSPYTFALCAPVDAVEWAAWTHKEREDWKARKAEDVRWKAEQEAQARTKPSTTTPTQKADPFGKVADRMTKLAGLE